jgi:hypothetical protein
LDIIRWYGQLLGDGRVAGVGQRLVVVGKLNPATLQQQGQHLDPRAAAQFFGRDHAPIGTAGGSAQLGALGCRKLGEGVHDCLPYLT